MFNLVPDIITDYWQNHAPSDNQEVKRIKPADEFKRFCEDEPWAPECKVFDV